MAAPNSCQWEGGELVEETKPRWNAVKPWNRHGLILTVVGIAYILIGVTYILAEPSEARQEALSFALSIMPYDWWGVGFVVVGIISTMSSRWPSLPRTLGYSTLTGWSSAWAGFHIVGGLSQHATHLSYAAGGLAWGLMGFLWWAISGLICPPKERGVCGRPAPFREPRCRFDCGIVRVSDTAGVIESKSERETGSFPSQHGDGSVRKS
ncbi:gp039 [Rhodococcus phage ReqiPoco6]|uniref:Gp039 n=1 Tax=Rhodococcus phage ReqiPoco6 TaxID=691964 RepID=D4P7Q7_9CAUD|nr:gp039 [Rhodococcus phage ReqiPoco6]ADD81037.1 gp039 [Rhodococcus phage ReqiPoco6]